MSSLTVSSHSSYTQHQQSSLQQCNNSVSTSGSNRLAAQSAGAVKEVAKRQKSIVAGMPGTNNNGKSEREGGKWQSTVHSTTTLETTLDSTTKSLKIYKERLATLVNANAELQQQCLQQENDAIEVMGALRDESEKKDEEIRQIRTEIEKERQLHSKEKNEVIMKYEKKIEELNAHILEKEATIKLVEQEFSSVKDFKKKRLELLKELEFQKAQNTELDRRYKEAMIRMERKFFEEKVRLQKETNRKITELAAKAHREAILSLDETTKEIFKENVRLTEALKSHVTMEEELQKSTEALAKMNKRLSQEKEMNDLIVKDKIVQNKSQTKQIKDLQGKIAALEHSLSHIVREFEYEKELIGKKSKIELDELKKVTAQLKINLDRRTAEMKYIKKLAQHVLSQRTDLEKFFMDALDHVRDEIREERKNKRIEASKEFNKRLRQANVNPTPISPFDILRERKKSNANITRYLESDPIANPMMSSSSAEPKGGEESKNAEEITKEKEREKIDIKDLSWEDKEKVLRVLFAKVNGMMSSNEGGGASEDANNTNNTMGSEAKLNDLDVGTHQCASGEQIQLEHEGLKITVEDEGLRDDDIDGNDKVVEVPFLNGSRTVITTSNPAIPVM